MIQMNPTEMENMMKSVYKVGKKLIDHWHKKKLEQNRIERCSRVMPR